MRCFAMTHYEWQARAAIAIVLEEAAREMERRGWDEVWIKGKIEDVSGIIRQLGDKT